MEFHVPQFIDVEDKIAGNFSITQIVFLVGGAFFSYVLWNVLPGIISFPLVSIILALSLALAFYPKEKYGKPFIGVMEAAFRFYFIDPKLYTWKRIPKKREQMVESGKKTRVSVTVPNISESKLKDLSWGLDVAGNIAN